MNRPLYSIPGAAAARAAEMALPDAPVDAHAPRVDRVDAGQRLDPCGHDGDGRRLSDRAHARAVFSGASGTVRGCRGRRGYAADRRLQRTRSGRDGGTLSASDALDRLVHSLEPGGHDLRRVRALHHDLAHRSDWKPPCTGVVCHACRVDQPDDANREQRSDQRAGRTMMAEFEAIGPKAAPAKAGNG